MIFHLPLHGLINFNLTSQDAGRNYLNEEITPLLPSGKDTGERYSQTMSNLGHAALLRRRELPLKNSALYS